MCSTLTSRVFHDVTWLADACDDVKCGAFLLAALRQPVNVNILVRSGGDHRGLMSWSGIDRRSERWRRSWPLVSGHWDWRTRSIDQWLERLLLLMAGPRWEELVCRSSEISFISFFRPRLWPLSCERPDTPEPPVPLLFLTFVASRPPETSEAALKLLPQHACFGFKVSQNLPGWNRKDFDCVLIVRCGSYGSPSGPW